jgi:hypothetical protein
MNQKENRACIIKYIIEKGGYRNPETEWESIRITGIDIMKRLDNSLRPFLNK